MSENLLDLKYLNRDGDAMRGPLALVGSPSLDAHATDKRYVDTVLANLRVLALLRDGSQPMTGALSLAGPPVAGLDATSKNYVDALAAAAATIAYVDAQNLLDRAYTDAQDVLERAYVDAQILLQLPRDGSIAMTGLLTLSGAPINNLHAATKLYVDTAIPAATLDTYDAIVAAAGGDYTSIVTACATEAVGARIYIKPGTYAETANIALKDGQQLIGANPDTTIIDFGAANRKIVFNGATVNLLVQNLTIQNSIADRYIDLDGNYSKVDNCRLVGSANANVGAYFAGDYAMLTNTVFTGFTKAGTYCAHMADGYGIAIGNQFISSQRGLSMDSYCAAIGNTFRLLTNEQAIFQAYCVVTGNIFLGSQKVVISGASCMFSGNYFITGADGLEWDGTHDSVTISGNFFNTSEISCTDVNTSDCSIVGNTFTNGAGVYIAGDNFSVVGNTFKAAAFIELAATARACAITGNNLEGSTAADRLVDAGVGNTATHNSGLNHLYEKTFFRMKNTSGGDLLAGDVVVLKLVAAGDEFDTTVAAGDDHVWGMLAENINNNAYGFVQQEGKTTLLKVNGTAAIAVGDFLSCFNAAGITRQALANHTMFAIALEAYAVADSLGVIDALLVPRHHF